MSLSFSEIFRISVTPVHLYYDAARPGGAGSTRFEFVFVFNFLPSSSLLCIESLSRTVSVSRIYPPRVWPDQARQLCSLSPLLFILRASTRACCAVVRPSNFAFLLFFAALGRFRHRLTSRRQRPLYAC